MKFRPLTFVLLTSVGTIGCSDLGPSKLVIVNELGAPQPAAVAPRMMLEPSALQFTAVTDDASMDALLANVPAATKNPLARLLRTEVGASGWRFSEPSESSRDTRIAESPDASRKNEADLSRALTAWSKPVVLVKAGAGSASTVRVHVGMLATPDTIQLASSSSSAEFLHVALKAVARLRTQTHLSGRTVTATIHSATRETLPRSWSSYLDYKLSELDSKPASATVEIRVLERK